MKKFVTSVLLRIIRTLAAGYVLSYLWSWFIVRKFALPELGYLDAVGLILVVNFFSIGDILNKVQADAEKESMKNGKEFDSTLFSIIASVMMILVGYPLALGGGYLWHYFIR